MLGSRKRKTLTLHHRGGDNQAVSAAYIASLFGLEYGSARYGISAAMIYPLPEYRERGNTPERLGTGSYI